MIRDKGKILIVDDKEGIRKEAGHYFKEKGYVVFTVGSGEKALPLIKECCPDVIILDLDLPGMNGLEMLAQARQFNKSSRVIIVSGQDIDVRSSLLCRKLDITDFKAKPVALKDLESRISGLLGVPDKQD